MSDSSDKDVLTPEELREIDKNASQASIDLPKNIFDATPLVGNIKASSTFLALYELKREGLGTLEFVIAALVPRGQPLPNSEKLEQFIHSGLFPDKPKDMSYVEYFQNFTELDSNLTAALERLEFGVLDYDNLQTAIRLAEDAHRLRELADNSRRAFPTLPIFSFKGNQNAWTKQQRQKFFQFMQHSVYSARYETNKLRNIRKRYANSSVFRMGLRIGTNLELKEVAAHLYSTMDRMVVTNTSMLWYLFHYEKLLNMNYDVANNVEYIFLLQKQLDDGILHQTAVPPLPTKPGALTTLDPENIYKK